MVLLQTRESGIPSDALEHKTELGRAVRLLAWGGRQGQSGYQTFRLQSFRNLVKVSVAQVWPAEPFPS